MGRVLEIFDALVVRATVGEVKRIVAHLPLDFLPLGRIDARVQEFVSEFADAAVDFGDARGRSAPDGFPRLFVLAVIQAFLGRGKRFGPNRINPFRPDDSTLRFARFFLGNLLQLVQLFSRKRTAGDFPERFIVGDSVFGIELSRFRFRGEGRIYVSFERRDHAAQIVFGHGHTSKQNERARDACRCMP